MTSNGKITIHKLIPRVFGGGIFLIFFGISCRAELRPIITKGPPLVPSFPRNPAGDRYGSRDSGWDEPILRYRYQTKDVVQLRIPQSYLTDITNLSLLNMTENQSEGNEGVFLLQDLPMPGDSADFDLESEKSISLKKTGNLLWITIRPQDERKRWSASDNNLRIGVNRLRVVFRKYDDVNTMDLDVIIKDFSIADFQRSAPVFSQESGAAGFEGGGGFQWWTNHVSPAISTRRDSPGEESLATGSFNVISH
jgi:hypothetical protein